MMRTMCILMSLCIVLLCTTLLSADTMPSQKASTEEVRMDVPYTFNNINNPHDEMVEIEKTIRASIEWAVKNKDTDLLYSSVIQNDELFFFQTDSRSTITGFDEFKSVTENFFMREDFKALRVEIKDLRIHMSPTQRTAWFACILNDYNEFQGKPANWENVRWTGALEKIDGTWKIFQMHFSKAEDLIQQ